MVAVIPDSITSACGRASVIRQSWAGERDLAGPGDPLSADVGVVNRGADHWDSQRRERIPRRGGGAADQIADGCVPGGGSTTSSALPIRSRTHATTKPHAHSSVVMPSQAGHPVTDIDVLLDA
jgi:hypothetical protein